MDRLNTKDMIIRKHWNIEDGPECVLCPTQHLETRDHLFFQCNSSIRIWTYLQIDWTLGSDMVQVAKAAREAFNKPFFAEVVFIAWWNICMLRKAKCFKHQRPYFATWRVGLIHDLTLLSYMIKPRFKEELLRRIDFLSP